MKKLLKTLIVSAAVFACAMTTTFANPSASTGGEVVGDIIIDGEVVKDATAKFEAIPENLEPTAKKIIEEIKVGGSIAEVLKDVEIILPEGKKIEDFKLLSEFSNLVVRDAEGKILENAKNVTVTWTVPNLTANADVLVLHYSVARDVWETIVPKSVDVTNGTVTAFFEDLSPVAVIHIPKADPDKPGPNVPDSGDATNMALYAGVGVAALAVVAVMVYRNKKYN